MTLRTRLLVGVLAVVAVVVLAGSTVAVIQHGQLVNQLDRQLEGYAQNASRISNRPTGAPPASQGDTGVADAYVGVLLSDGTLQTLLAPSDDPDLVPDLTDSGSLTEPATIATTSGEADRVRVVAVDLGDDRLLILALPTTDVDDSLRLLIVTQLAAGGVIIGVLALFVWWMIRHGLRPIRMMTESADAITAGAVDRRVEHPTGGTEAARLGRALNAMIDTTHEAEAQRRRFVADVSHELRTPLTTLEGYTALYSRGALDEPGSLDDAMRRINDEAGRMKRIVEQLLVLAELDENRPAETQAVAVGTVLADIAADVGALQPDRVVTVDVTGELTVDANLDQLMQALTALTANALRYTPTDTPLAYSALSDGDDVRIEVADRGPGIPAPDVPHIFERFYRADKGRTRSTGGNGLGLAIVAAIATSHRGTFGVADTPGGGSTFWIRLPKHSTPTEPHPALGTH
ncbi:MAG: sensor histidine kinase [Ilumatobacter sp.]